MQTSLKRIPPRVSEAEIVASYRASECLGPQEAVQALYPFAPLMPLSGAVLTGERISIAWSDRSSACPTLHMHKQAERPRTATSHLVYLVSAFARRTTWLPSARAVRDAVSAMISSESYCQHLLLNSNVDLRSTSRLRKCWKQHQSAVTVN